MSEEETRRAGEEVRKSLCREKPTVLVCLLWTLHVLTFHRGLFNTDRLILRKHGTNLKGAVAALRCSLFSHSAAAFEDKGRMSASMSAISVQATCSKCFCSVL